MFVIGPYATIIIIACLIFLYAMTRKNPRP